MFTFEVDNEPVKFDPIEEIKIKKKTPFDFSNSIDQKDNLRLELDGYSAFMVNRIYSQYKETIFIANEINKYSINNLWHYDFFFNAIERRKRFAKWGKPSIDENTISIISEYYNISKSKAIDLIGIVDLVELKNKLYRGGTK